MQTKAGPYSIGSQSWPGLSKLIEECGEVLQIAGKIIGANGEDIHFSGINLRAKLAEELADLMAACVFVAQHNNIDYVDRYMAKLRQFMEWHEGQQQKPRCTCANASHEGRDFWCPIHGG